MLTRIRVPKADGGWSYLKFNRRAQDWALVGVAAVRSNGGVRRAHEHGPDAAARLRRRGGGERRRGPGDRGGACRRGTSPPSDAFASAEYRSELVKVLVRRALEEALG